MRSLTGVELISVSYAPFDQNSFARWFYFGHSKSAGVRVGMGLLGEDRSARNGSDSIGSSAGLLSGFVEIAGGSFHPFDSLNEWLNRFPYRQGWRRAKVLDSEGKVSSYRIGSNALDREIRDAIVANPRAVAAGQSVFCRLASDNGYSRQYSGENCVCDEEYHRRTLYAKDLFLNPISRAIQAILLGCVGIFAFCYGFNRDLQWLCVVGGAAIAFSTLVIVVSVAKIFE